MHEALQVSQDVGSEFNQQEITNEYFLLDFSISRKESRDRLSKRWVPVPTRPGTTLGGTAKIAGVDWGRRRDEDSPV